MIMLRVGWRERGGFGRPFFASRVQVRDGSSRGHPDEIRRKTQDVHSRKMRCSDSGARGPGTAGHTQSQDARRKINVDISNRKV